MANLLQRDLTSAYADFKRAYPDYGSTSALDEMRAAEYGRLDQKGVVYLDYTGAGLYSDSQIRQHLELLRDGLFGNPHSINEASEAATLYAPTCSNSSTPRRMSTSPYSPRTLRPPSSSSASRIRSLRATATC